MGEYAEDALMLAESTEGEDWLDWESVEPVPTAIEVALYQLATVFYDYHVHPEAADQIEKILEHYGRDVIDELL